jgi:hypothetical protein
MSDDIDVTPARVIRENFRWLAPVAIVGCTLIGLFGVFCLVAWPLHAWLWHQQVNLQNSVYQDSPGAQQADIDQLESAVQAISGSVDGSQIIADVNQACKFATRITIMPPGDAPWVAQNCLAGSISPSSTYSSAGS